MKNKSKFVQISTRAAFPLQLYLLLTENGLKRKKRIGNPVFQARTDAAITEINTDIEEIKGQLSGSLANLGSSSKDTSSKLKVDFNVNVKTLPKCFQGMEQALEELQDKLWDLDKV